MKQLYTFLISLHSFLSYAQPAVACDANFIRAQLLGSVASTLSIALIPNKTYFCKARSSEGRNLVSCTSSISFSTMQVSS